MGKIEDILRRVENNEATDEEMTMAEEHLRGFHGQALENVYAAVSVFAVA